MYIHNCLSSLKIEESNNVVLTKEDVLAKLLSSITSNRGTLLTCKWKVSKAKNIEDNLV